MTDAKHRRGFSLPELLVLLAILVVCAPLLFIGVRHLFAKGGQLKCQQRMEQIYRSCLMYANQNRGTFPPCWDYGRSRAWYDTLVRDGLLDSELAIGCPDAEVEVTVGEVGQSRGMPPKIKDGIVKALEWLKNHQAVSGPDNQFGHWGHNGNHRSVHGLPRSTGPTALGLLCFLGYGCTTTQPPKYAETVTRALRTLLYEQNAAGAFSTRTTHDQYYNAVATMAVCDAYAMMGDISIYVDGERKSLHDAAFAAFQWMCGQQNPNHGGFPYGCCSAGNDVSTSVWAYQGFLSARRAGFALTETVQNRTATFLRHCLADNGEWVPYWYSYDGRGYRANGHDGHTRNRMTAAYLFARLTFGGVPGQSDVETPLAWLKKNDRHVHIAQHTGGNYDLYFVYYLTLALRLLGGPDWTSWKDAFIDNCLERQSADGHWDQHYVPYGRCGGDVYPTMLGCVALQATVGDYLQGTKWCTAGEHSYGYNKLLGLDCGSPAPDTIVLMDYTRWGFEREDGSEHLAPRHGGKLNVLFGDGTVKPMHMEPLLDTAGKLKQNLLTPATD